MECVRLLQAMNNYKVDILEYFWKVIIVYHILHLFGGFNVSGIDFYREEIETVVRKVGDRNNEQLSSTDQFIQKIYRGTIDDAFKEIINLTNAAFDVSSVAKPVFLLDNIHSLANMETGELSKKYNIPYTYLATLMNQLTSYRPIYRSLVVACGEIILVIFLISIILNL